MRSYQIVLAAVLSALTFSAHAALDESKTLVTGGQFTPYPPPVTVTFDSAIPAGIHYDNLDLKIGTVTNSYEAPAFDTTKYLRIGGTTTITFDAGYGASYFGFYIGSTDASNTLTLHSSDGTTRVYGEGDLLGLVPAGATGNSFYLNLWSTAGTAFTSIEFKTVNPLETDNHAFILTAVPEPETYAMLLGGLALVGVVARRRRS